MTKKISKTMQVVILVAVFAVILLMQSSPDSNTGIEVIDYDAAGNVIQREFVPLPDQLTGRSAQVSDQYWETVYSTLPSVPSNAVKRVLRLVIENTGDVDLSIDINDAKLTGSYWV